jgi:hypothetical protein
MYITNTTDTAMADPRTANKTNGIAPNTPALVALRKPLTPFLCSLLPVGECIPRRTYLWNYKRPLAANPRKNAGRRSLGGHRPAWCICNGSFPTWGVAKPSCYFLELLLKVKCAKSTSPTSVNKGLEKTPGGSTPGARRQNPSGLAT